MKKLPLIAILILIVGVSAFFLFHRKQIPLVVVPDTNKPITLSEGRQCYSYSHEATPDAPYAVTERLDITIAGGSVTGTKTGTQAGPDMTNGYTGTITGTVGNNIITDIYSYTVEGSHNQEKEIYRASPTGIEKLRYPLTDDYKILSPDTTKEFTAMLYARVPCDPSN